jgi:hypothetical protein
MTRKYTRKNRKKRESKKKKRIQRGGNSKTKKNKKEKNFWQPGNYWKKWGLVNLLPTNLRNSIWFYRTGEYGLPPIPKFW